ncbi:hypothetical protein [Candidatus Igneacidithiobacillus taiwanensis]|uniref:hypothetical protein n=1 Tax=Candidatus Igneacidithiobacillus taiwanensis TaxID=1945924 RepID=UPI0028984E59|nr:hypothetical protein [Candidatus Igneacidithiobacillus taiwanensis]
MGKALISVSDAIETLRKSLGEMSAEEETLLWQLRNAPIPPAAHYDYGMFYDGICDCYLCTEHRAAQRIFALRGGKKNSADSWFRLVRATDSRLTIYSEISFALRNRPEFEARMERVFWALLSHAPHVLEYWLQKDNIRTTAYWIKVLAPA